MKLRRILATVSHRANCIVSTTARGASNRVLVLFQGEFGRFIEHRCSPDRRAPAKEDLLAGKLESTVLWQGRQNG
jgi:hypothetical protein